MSNIFFNDYRKEFLAEECCVEDAGTGGGGGGPQLVAVQMSGDDLQLIFDDSSVIQAPLHAANVVTTASITIGETTFVAGTSVQTILAAISSLAGDGNISGAVYTNGVLTITTTDALVFNVPINADNTPITSAITIGTTTYAIGTSVETILDALANVPPGTTVVVSADAGNLIVAGSDTGAFLDEIPVSADAGNLIVQGTDLFPYLPVTSIPVENGLHIENDAIHLGGALIENTTIDGSNFFMHLTDLLNFRVEVPGNALQSITMLGNLSTPVRIQSQSAADLTIYGVLEVDTEDSRFAQVDSNGSGSLTLDSASAKIESDTLSGGQRSVFVDDVGTYATNLPPLTTETDVVMIDPVTGKLAYGQIAGPTGDIVYSASEGARVTASGPGVTFDRVNPSLWRFTIPTGVDLRSFDIHSTPSESATSTIDIEFVWVGVRPFNQDASDDMTDGHVPILTTLRKGSAVGTLALYQSAAANTPAWRANVTVPGTLQVGTVEFSKLGSGTLPTHVKGVF